MLRLAGPVPKYTHLRTGPAAVPGTQSGLDPEKRTLGLCSAHRLTALPFVLQGTDIAQRRVATHGVVPRGDEVGDGVFRRAL
jgi:hypothetical protein